MRYLILFLFVSFSFAQTTQWQIDWDDNPAEDNVNSYQVFRSFDGTNFTVLASTPYSYFNVVNLNSGVIYYYYVIACNSYGCSDPSEIVFQSIPQVSQIPSQIIAYDGEFTPIAFNNYLNEPDGDPITWTFESTNDSLRVVDGVIVRTLPFSGTVNITAIATDPQGFYGWASFNLTILPEELPQLPEKVTNIQFRKVD